MRVQIREELRNEFYFLTYCGMQVDNEEIYFARYHNEIFQIFILDKFRTIENIDFEVVEEEFFTDEMHNAIFIFQPGMGAKYACGEQVTSKNAKNAMR